MLPDERAVVVDVCIKACVRGQTVQGVAARGNADDGCAGTQVHEQGSTGVAVAGIGIVPGGPDRICVLPADELVSVLADIVAVNGLDGAPTFHAIVGVVAAAAPKAGFAVIPE